MRTNSAVYVAGALLVGATIVLGQVEKARAQIPQQINYQGRLTDDTGQPVADGEYTMQFEIHRDSTGHAPVWTSQPETVLVVNGLFNYQLGSHETMPIWTFSTDTPLWLAITLGSGSSAEEILPRSRLVSTPYAFKAYEAEYAHLAFNADTAGIVRGGVGVTQIIRNDAIEIEQGYMYPLAYDSILAPAAGYVMCQASVNMFCSHTTGVDACLNLEFRDTSLVHMDDQEFYWCLASALPSDDYLTSYSIHRVFAVDSGYNWYYLIAIDFGDPGDSYIVRKAVMTLTFILESYGTVQTVGVASDLMDQPERIPLDGQ
ncbi:MAG: hypothetical protein JSU65_02080 [Candidatus Zixiibacteriota bacterium]|nr:MAG: hypothetical protein JSU65_02080 [candidate division Zixibacteria bacterium]